MNNRILIDRLPFAAGVTALGAVCLAFHDFALQWQSAPDWFKALPFAVILNAVWLIATGIALLIPRLAFAGAVSATVLFGLWSLIFHGPLVAQQPAQVYLWLGVAEAGCLMAAGLALSANDNTRITLAARIIFGLCAVIFGLSHFVYAEVTAKMVPGWLPFPLAWAYLTGAGHLLAGLALVSGLRARLAAGMEAAMCAAFVILLHLPRLIAAPTNQVEWTMTCMALSITGAAWVIRSHIK
ncbi:hypothetical protein ABAC460_10635 [Asticcacaulis sp. AC460]|uniref:DoxX family membrane protein n=1 Tax=Asticcacaulis sp. AC460 TaxID=1282360 RepID=UPI0003C3B643|nr:DoxX family membrane protein [Asticcacaulis sp. AC460]ESQ90198.1 hypothetical protein ABAC460_10635 [Asticcacaulis sp. AC460]